MRWCLALLLSAGTALYPASDGDYRRSPGAGMYEKANALFVEKKFQESDRLVGEALRLDPNLLPALTLKAKLAMVAQNPAVARQALLQAVRVAPASWYAQFLLGFHQHMENDLHPALESLTKAVQLNPEQAQPHLYLGLTHESLGHTEDALKHYRQAVQLETVAKTLQPETLLTLARLLLLTGGWEECADLLNRAVKLDPNARDTHYERARLLVKQGKGAEAARAGEQALRLPQAGISDAQIRYVLVRAYTLAGDEKKASEHARSLRGPATAP